MKLNLSVKIFVTFLLVTVTSSLLIVIAVRVSNRYFERYSQQKDLKKLEYLADAVAEFYVENNGWDILNQNPDLWRSFLNSGSSKVDLVMPSQEGRPPLEPSITMRPISMDRVPPMPIWDPQALGPRLILFDSNKRRITGNPEGTIDNCDIIPVIVDDATVGWVGLRSYMKGSDTLDQAYLRKQSMIIFITGGIVLLASSFFALIFSRHLLRPIRLLADATKALTQRNFDVRINVQSSDELGDLAERFNFMAKKMDDYEQNQLRWLSDISHELRTPLSVLIGEIEAIQDGVRKADEKSLRSLCDEAKHLEKLVNDLHTLSLAEAGAISMKMVSVKPISVLNEVIYHFKNRIENSEMSLEVSLKPRSDELTVLGDPMRLVQLFSNIIENALIHAEKPGRLIIRQTNTKDSISLIFEDTGPGVPEDSLPRLFERLYRADSSRSRSTGGSGLGLAICKTIAELHHGAIKARNGDEGGLEIEVTLPLAA
ncbi:MAG: HAMP domain-containing protein [Deltaproteobacteria bacterium]|nr:HAMP domain-containing protein [Deltaproteobacteria bacterium]